MKKAILKALSRLFDFDRSLEIGIFEDTTPSPVLHPTENTFSLCTEEYITCTERTKVDFISCVEAAKRHKLNAGECGSVFQMSLSECSSRRKACQQGIPEFGPEPPPQSEDVSEEPEQLDFDQEGGDEL